MADTNLPSTPADGNIKTVIVPAVADLKNVLLTEANAASAIDISCYLTAGGFAFTVEQATITDERECDTITRGKGGRATPALTLTGIDNTNTEFTDSNELVEALARGSNWVALRRRGKSHTDPFVAGDKITATRFEVGYRSEVAAEANSVLRSTWATFIDGFEPDAEIVTTAP